MEGLLSTGPIPSSFSFTSELTSRVHEGVYGGSESQISSLLSLAEQMSFLGPICFNSFYSLFKFVYILLCVGTFCVKKKKCLKGKKKNNNKKPSVGARRRPV